MKKEKTEIKELVKNIIYTVMNFRKCLQWKNKDCFVTHA